MEILAIAMMILKFGMLREKLFVCYECSMIYYSADNGDLDDHGKALHTIYNKEVNLSDSVSHIYL
jgi:hypothetical protein